MNKFVPRRIWVAFASLALLLLPMLAFSGEFETVSPSKSTYKIWLVSWGVQSIFVKGTTLDASLVWVDPSKVVINVLEPLGSGQKRLKWEYGIGQLGVGDDFVAQGEMYRVTNINTKSVRLAQPYSFVGWCVQKSCAPFVTVIRLSRIVSPSGRDALILSQRGILPAGPKSDGTAWINAKSDECMLTLYLDGLKKGRYGYNAQIRSKLNASYYQGNVSKCHEQVHTGRVEANVGDALDFGDFGRFKVESIWPAGLRHQAWVVLVPEGKRGRRHY